MRLHDPRIRELQNIEEFDLEDPEILNEEEFEEGYEPGVRDWYNETGHTRGDF